MKIGFIGFGSLGTVIAGRLLSQKYEIIGWNRTKGKLAPLPVVQAGTPADVINQTEIVVLNLFDSKAVEDVLYSCHGLLNGDVKGKIIIDTTTNHFEKVVSFHSSLESKGGMYLEAPVLGSVIPASQGNLTVLVSGKKEVLERVGTVLNAIGRTIVYLGEPGLATKMKLVNNLVLGAFMAAIAEALVLGESIGVTREKVLDILALGAGSSGILNAKKEKLLQEDFSSHFSIDAIKKDIGYLSELAGTVKQPLEIGKLVEEILGKAVSAGLGNLDFSSMYRVLKR